MLRRIIVNNVGVVGKRVHATFLCILFFFLNYLQDCWKVSSPFVCSCY